MNRTLRTRRSQVRVLQGALLLKIPNPILQIPSYRPCGLILETAPRMTWYTWLIAAALVAAIAAITGIKPKGTRHVAHTSLMGVARIVLLIFLAVVVFVALYARMGH